MIITRKAEFQYIKKLLGSLVLRTFFFLIFNIISFMIYFHPMKILLESSLVNEIYSHIILIPFVSAYFIFKRRSEIFIEVKYALSPGIILIIIGATLYLIGADQGSKLSHDDYLSLISLSVIILWIGGFILVYGPQAFYKARFPILFLIFMVPLPVLATQKIIYLLQSASAEVSHIFFKMAGVPVFREGFVFHLPGISIEVAEQCSGIRSSLALFVMSILTGHLFLCNGWTKAFLGFSIFPITVLKNGIRIVTLSLLGAYVDERFVTQSLLHSRGGIFFFLPALGLMLVVIWALKKLERSVLK